MQQPFININGTSPRLNYDLAVVNMDADTRAGARFLRLNINSRVMFSCSVVRAADYGTLSAMDENYNVNDVLHQVYVPVVS